MRTSGEDCAAATDHEPSERAISNAIRDAKRRRTTLVLDKLIFDRSGIAKRWSMTNIAQSPGGEIDSEQLQSPLLRTVGYAFEEEVRDVIKRTRAYRIGSGARC